MARRPKVQPSILVVQNAECEGPGLIATHASATGARLAVVELFRKARGDHSLPFDLLEKGAYSAAVSLGSPSTAYRRETNPHHEELLEFFRLIRRRRIPSFNICYSMQLFCMAHGGKVVMSPTGKEVGFCKLTLTPKGKSDRVFGPVGPHTTLEWHGDIVEELPQGAVLLARSKR